MNFNFDIMEVAINKVAKLITDNGVLVDNITNGNIPIQEIATDLEQILYTKDATALPDSSSISTDPSLIKCDNAYRSILLLKYKHEIETDVLKSIQSKLFNGQLKPDQVLDQFQKDLEKKLKEFEEREDVLRQDESYKEFRSTIWNIRHPNLPFTFGDEDEDDIQMVAEMNDYLCPITRSLMVDPYKAPCGHYFSDAILQLIRNGPIDCPVTGCRQTVQKTTLRRDQALAKKIARHSRQMEEARVNRQFEDVE
jgi:SUMO ligase MMS21 Smc5/6 complex component